MQITDVLTNLKVGEDGWVKATLTNPCKTVPFEQLVLRISDSSREIIPQGAEVLTIRCTCPRGREDSVSHLRSGWWMRAAANHLHCSGCGAAQENQKAERGSAVRVSRENAKSLS